MRPFKLHSMGDNWFHFRVDPKSYMESFSMTFCHDGTVVMTGDMGVVAWQRRILPDKPDYGFPDCGTHISYFAEKIVRAGDGQCIREWQKEAARKDLNEALNGYDPDHDVCSILAINHVLEQLDGFEDGEYGRIQMYLAFEDEHHEIEGEDLYQFGERYTDGFVRRFDMIRSVSGQILDAVIARACPVCTNIPIKKLEILA